MARLDSPGYWRANDPDYWRSKAKQRYMIAESFRGARKQVILHIANDYERMAANAEERLKLRKRGTRAKHDQWPLAQR